MLREIEIFNVNSIVEAKFDFRKGKYDYGSKMIFGNDVVSPIAIYGFNGTGKSSLINAMLQTIFSNLNFLRIFCFSEFNSK